METNWKTIADAVALIRSGVVARVDGAGWKAYRVGVIIRIDLG
jgi:hypothetical protein